jgi:hypothetical protein
MKPFRLSAFAIALALAACTSSPTDSPARLDPAAASYDGGASLGSGNNTSEENGGSLTGDGLSDGETTVPVDTVTRGPGMLGSGN